MKDMITKRYRKLLTGLVLFTIHCSLFTLFLVSCSDDNEPARTPSLQANVSKTNLEINESMEIHFTGVADQIVVFTGDKDHQYERRDSSNTGFAVNKGLFTYSYHTPGTFHVVCIASTYDTYLGKSLKTDMYSFDVTVTDDVNTIDAISATVTPNVYYAQLIGDDTWVMRLPQKQLYNNREIAVNASRQRLNLSIESDSAKVTIDGEPYNSRTYYALNADHAIRVVSASGTVRDYTLYGMVYPELLTVTVGEKEATLRRSAYYQDLLTYIYTGDDPTLDFTVDDGVQLLDGQSVVSPGSPIVPNHEYTLRRTHGSNTQVTADSRIIFSKE